jgi:hypothetical protein
MNSRISNYKTSLNKSVGRQIKNHSVISGSFFSNKDGNQNLWGAIPMDQRLLFTKTAKMGEPNNSSSIVGP